MSEELTTVEKKQDAIVKSFDLQNDQLPDLDDAKVFPASLAPEYWKPAGEGEFRNCFYQGTASFNMPNMNDPDKIESVECAILLAQLEDKSLRVLTNASKRLVSCLKDAEESGKIVKGTPLRIVYKGEETNSTNNKKSNRWEVNPLSA